MKGSIKPIPKLSSWKQRGRIIKYENKKGARSIALYNYVRAFIRPRRFISRSALGVCIIPLHDWNMTSRKKNQKPQGTRMKTRNQKGKDEQGPSCFNLNCFKNSEPVVQHCANKEQETNNQRHKKYQIAKRAPVEGREAPKRNNRGFGKEA